MHPCLRLLALLPCVASAGPALSEVQSQIAVVGQELQALPSLPTSQAVERTGFHSAFVGTTQAARWVQVDLGEARAFDSLVVVPASFPPSNDASGTYGMPRRFRVDVSDDADFASYQTLADHTEADLVIGASPLFIAAPGKARYVRFTATRLEAQRLGRGVFCLGELMVFAGPLNIAVGCTVTSSGANENQPTWAQANLTDGLTHLGPPVESGTLRSNGWHSAIATSPDHAVWVQADLGQSWLVDELRLYPTHPPDFPERPGFGFPVRFRIETDDTPAFQNPRMVFDATSSDFVNPADNALVIPLHSLPGRCWRITATRLWKRTQDFVFSLAELEIWSGGTNVALNSAVKSSDETRAPAWDTTKLVDGQTSLGQIVGLPHWLQGLSRRRELEQALTGLREQEKTLSAERQQQWLLLGGITLLAAAVGGVILHYRQRLQQRRSLASLRRQIARDLHDEIGSSLGSISLISELAMRDGDTAALQEVHRLSREAAESMRGIIWLVRETETPTLARLVETMRQTAATLLSGIAWELRAPQDDSKAAPSLDVHRHLFLFFKEAVHNIARHARARTALIEVDWTTSALRLRVSDDGAGFDPAAASPGSGLANLRHRAESLHGTLNIESQPGQGTILTLEVPLS